MNPMAWVVTALKTFPEHVSLPEAVDGADLVTLAEARSRLAQIAQCATELRRLVDRELAVKLTGGALRYGDTILKPATRGRPKVTDREGWWAMVTSGVAGADDPAGLLAALYPADAVRLTALPQLAAILETDEQALRDTFIEYEPPTSVLDAQPVERAPKWAQKLQDGQFSGARVG